MKYQFEYHSRIEVLNDCPIRELAFGFCPIEDRYCDFFTTQERPDWCPLVEVEE